MSLGCRSGLAALADPYPDAVQRGERQRPDCGRGQDYLGLGDEEIAAYKSSGAGTFSITVSAMKPVAQEACCAPNAEGTAKVRLATGEACGCGIESTCC